MANWYPNLRGLVADQVERALRVFFDKVYALETKLNGLEGMVVRNPIPKQIESYLRSASGNQLIGALAQPLIGATPDPQLTTVGTGVGSVTSVGLAVPGIFGLSGSPVTSAGTLTVSLTNQTANKVFAGPGSGGATTPAFRSLVSADFPIDVVQSLNSKVTAAAPYTNDGYIQATINGVTVRLMTTA